MQVFGLCTWLHLKLKHPTILFKDFLQRFKILQASSKTENFHQVESLHLVVSSLVFHCSFVTALEDE